MKCFTQMSSASLSSYFHQSEIYLLQSFPTEVLKIVRKHQCICTVSSESSLAGCHRVLQYLG